MPFTTVYKRWDLILVSFPFTNFTASKRRPALIVSPNSYNVGADVTIAFVTSQLNTPVRIGDYHLQFWQEAGLPKASLIRMKFATVDKSIIVKTIGRIKTEDQANIEKTILSFFGS